MAFADYWWMFFIIVPVGLALYYFYSESRKERTKPSRQLQQAKERLEALKQETEQIKSSKSVTEEKYYRREIDEAAFKKMMESYEQKIIENEVKIRELEKQLKTA